MKNRYIVIGGISFRSYTGTVTYSSLRIVGSGNSSEEIQKIVSDNIEECGGLMIVIDAEEGKEANI